MGAFGKKQALSVIALLAIPQMTLAWQWKDLWWRQDQQAMQLFERKEYPEAAVVFRDKNWQGAAHYRAKNFDQAASQFAQDSSSLGRYNYGNALAQQGKLEEALKAYEKALKIQPHFSDAQFNYDKVKEALQDQQKKQKENSGSDQKPQSENKKNDQSGSGEKQPQENKQDSDGEKPANDNGQNYPENDQDKKHDNTGQNTSPRDESNKKLSEDNDGAHAEGENQPAHAEESSEKENDPIGAELQASDQQQQQKDYRLQQWLQQIPDDPAGLLRRKFWRDHQRR